MRKESNFDLKTEQKELERVQDMIEIEERIE